MITRRALAGVVSLTLIAGVFAGAATATATENNLGLGSPSPDLCDGREYTIGYDTFADTQAFAVAVWENMQEAADATGCVTLVKTVDNIDATVALANVDTFIQRDVDGVILFQVLADAQAAIMNKLNNAGIPALAIAVPAPGATFLSINDYGTGIQGGEALAAAFNEKWPDELPYVIVSRFPAGGQLVIDRTNGVVDAIKAAFPDLPDENIITVDDNAGSADGSYTQASQVLGRLPKDAKILASGVNDDMVVGVYRALVQADRQENSLIVGMGAVYPSGAQAACQNPEYIGAVAYYPEIWGEYMIPAMLAVIQGKPVPASVFIPADVLDPVAIQETYPDLDC